MSRYLFLDFDRVLHPVGASVDRLCFQLELGCVMRAGSTMCEFQCKRRVGGRRA
jgi:hypothetical protein